MLFIQQAYESITDATNLKREGTNKRVVFLVIKTFIILQNYIFNWEASFRKPITIHSVDSVSWFSISPLRERAIHDYTFLNGDKRC